MTFLIPLIARLGIAQRFQKLAAWIATIIGAVMLCGALYGAWHLWLSNRDDTNQQIGASTQREGDLRTTLERVQEANRAEEKLDTDPDHRHAGCLRNSRTPENC